MNEQIAFYCTCGSYMKANLSPLTPPRQIELIRQRLQRNWETEQGHSGEGHAPTNARICRRNGTWQKETPA